MAKKISISRNHTLGLEGATNKLAELIGQMKEKYGLDATLKGDQAQIGGKGVKGTARVTASQINVDLELGLPASLIAPKIEEGVGRALDKHFG